MPCMLGDFMTSALSRRQFLSLAGSAASLPFGSTLFGTAAAAASRSNIQIVDLSQGMFFDRDACAKPKTECLRALADAGVKTIIRYYSGYYRNDPRDNYPCKNIRREERKILHDHGFSVAIVYQFMGRTRDRFSHATGLRDAEFCLWKAKTIDQPDKSTIFFGIDNDEIPLDGVRKYFAAVEETFRGKFTIGIYGAGLHCDRVLRDGNAHHAWLAEGPNWEGTRSFMNTRPWTLYQNKSNIKKSKLTAPFGIHYCTDILNPALKNLTIGAFDKDGRIVSYDRNDADTIGKARMWVNVLTLPVFDRPNGRQVTHLCTARMVHVLDIADGWARVDIDEDGFHEGFCDASKLSPLGSMPAFLGKACEVQPY